MIHDLWYKNAVIYCLDVETFADGNGDGVGDFVGLQRRLDYLAGLGVTCLWLMPFQPTPNRDNGYDITDHYGVDPRLGTLGDFVEFSHHAKQRGMRVIIDLVVNHTSDKHPWFQAARKDPDSRFHDFYVWADKKPKDAHKGMVFPGSQDSTWTYDRDVKAWYFHRFFPFQPELNVANPAVREELLKVMGYWLELGVSGFRVDAVPFLVELKGLKNHGIEDPYQLLREMREFLSWRSGDAILLAEANVTMDEVMNFFGKDGDRMQMVFNFAANQNVFLSLVTEDATPLAEALASAPRLPHIAQWANFLRNHDELDLGRLPAVARKRVFAELGPEPKMQLYGRGLRRRLSPMLSGDRRRLELAFSLMLSLPGTPVLWYGDELGMGEDLSLHERQSVRTPMQWTDEPHGGFTRAEPFRPVVTEAPYGYPQVNVETQRRDPASLLNWMERMVRMRKECPELGWGAWRLLRMKPENVLALRFDWKDETLVTLHNLSGKACEVSFSPGGPSARLVHMLSEAHSQPGKGGRHRVTLEGYGYRWFRMEPLDT